MAFTSVCRIDGAACFARKLARTIGYFFERSRQQKSGCGRRAQKIARAYSPVRKSYTSGLYGDDEHVFWAEIEGLQAQQNALESVVPEEVDAASQTLSGLADAWEIATLSERSELVKIIFDEIHVDLGVRKITKLQPKLEYRILFDMFETLQALDVGAYRIPA